MFHLAAVHRGKSRGRQKKQKRLLFRLRLLQIFHQNHDGGHVHTNGHFSADGRAIALVVAGIAKRLPKIATTMATTSHNTTA